MYGIEKKMYEQLMVLKEKYKVKGIKAEFEAEGSSFRDLVRLRRITAAAGLPLHLKIGGVEAVKDLKEAIELGVDGIIAPMVESPFGAKKFINSFEKIYKNNKIHFSINIETKTAFENYEKILEISKGKIDNITFGRSDFSASYFSKEVVPDSEFVMNAIIKCGRIAKENGFEFTVGGSVTSNTVKIYKDVFEIKEYVSKLETRKVMIPTEILLDNEEAIVEALRFEKLYILSKKEISDLFIESEVARLIELERRV